jgi:hypothetical protein
MKYLYSAVVLAASVALVPQEGFSQCYQNGVPCGQTQPATVGQPAPPTGTQVMGSDGTNSQTLQTDTAGRLISSIYSLPALPAGNNTIGGVNVVTLPALPAGSNAIGSVSVTALPALPSGSNAIGSITNTAFGISGTLPAFASTPTFNVGTVPTLTTNIQGAVTTAAPSYTNGNNNLLSLTTAGALRIDGSATTQPVSGTVNIGSLPALAAGTNAIGSITNTSFGATQSGTWNVGLSAGSNAIGTVGVTSLPALSAGTNSIGLVTNQAAVTTAAPSYTNGNTASLSLTTAGALRVDGSGVTQPVSGTVTANIGTAPNLNVTNLAGTAVMGNLLRTIAFSESSASLAASAAFTGTARDAGALASANPYNYFTCYAYSNVAGTLVVQASNDGSTYFPLSTTSVAAATPVMTSSRIIARYFQCKYTNGSTAQSSFFLNSQFGQ